MGCLEGVWLKCGDRTPSLSLQAKAQQVRDRLQEEQRLRSKLELEKVREARETRESRVRQWRREMEVRLQRADMLRESHLQEKVRKAQEEDAKVSVVAVCVGAVTVLFSGAGE